MPDQSAIHSPLPRFDGAPLPEAVSLLAVQWLVALQAPDADATTQAQWQRWRAAHPDHERAWQHIEQVGSRLQVLEGRCAGDVLTRAAQGRVGRRQVLKALMVGAVGVGLWQGQQSTAWRSWQADLRTARGERRALTLPDGGSLTLNTASAVDIRYDAILRRLLLVDGEILIATATDKAARRFVVDTAQGRLRAIGTRFLVRQREGNTELGVLDGAVEVRVTNGDSLIVNSGERVRFTASAIDVPAPLPPQADAWRNGMLIAHAMPLSDFIAELARHRPGYLACDTDIAGLQISGSYPLDDTDQVLDMLQRTHPVAIRRRTRYWVSVLPRAAG